MPKGICSIEGCAKDVKQQGWCTTHLSRWRKKGDPLAAVKKYYHNPADAIHEKAKRAGGCLIWTGTLTAQGYSYVRHENKRVLGHRWVYENEHGAIPDGMHVDHICGNRACVEPVHLRLATPKQNNENWTRLSSANTSGVHGVSWDKSKGYWIAKVKHNGVTYSPGSGYFKDLGQAEQAVVELRNKLHTHNARDRVA